MKKRLTKTGTNKLALAKAEFKNFQKKQQAKQVQQSAPPVPPAKPLAPKTAHKILLCSTHIGSLARLDFELSEAIATGIKATALQTTDASPGVIETPDLDSVLLKSKVKLSSTYNGCPHCGKMTICHCRYCGVISCAIGNQGHHKCPSCQREFQTVPLTDPINLTGNRERPQKPVTGPAPKTALPKNKTKALPKTTTKALPNKLAGLLPRK